MPLTLDQFRATRRPIDDDTWHVLRVEGIAPDVPRDACTIYGEGEDAYLIHELDGAHFVHAWWYAPISYADRNVAEEKLFAWYQEWN